MQLYKVVDPEILELDHILDILDAQERYRWRRYRNLADRQRHLAAHGGVRMVMADHTGIAPGDLRLDRDGCPLCGRRHGRPVVAGSSSEFSLAHTEAMVLIAVGDTPLGIDVEPLSRTDAAEHLWDMLHADEQHELATLEPGRRARAILSCWVRKEAVLKAIGTGLGRDPATVNVGPSTSALGHDVSGPRRGSVVEGWRVIDVDVGHRHVAALAVVAEPGSLPPPSVIDLTPRLANGYGLP